MLGLLSAESAGVVWGIVIDGDCEHCQIKFNQFEIWRDICAMTPVCFCLFWCWVKATCSPVLNPQRFVTSLSCAEVHLGPNLVQPQMFYQCSITLWIQTFCHSDCCHLNSLCNGTALKYNGYTHMLLACHVQIYGPRLITRLSISLQDWWQLQL